MSDVAICQIPSVGAKSPFPVVNIEYATRYVRSAQLTGPVSRVSVSASPPAKTNVHPLQMRATHITSVNERMIGPARSSSRDCRSPSVRSPRQVPVVNRVERGPAPAFDQSVVQRRSIVDEISRRLPRASDLFDPCFCAERCAEGAPEAAKDGF